jgi:hypothetical protein
VRYVLLVDISQDRATRSESTSQETHYHQVKNAKTDEYESEYDYTDYHVVRSGSRFVEARFIICDLETRRPVWIAVGKDGETSGNSSTSSSWPAPAPPWPGIPSSIGPIESIVAKAVGKLLR